MLFLIDDISSNLVERGGTHGERGVSFLPSKVADRDFVMDPRGRRLFEIADNIGKAISCFKPNEQMDMVPNASNLDWHFAEATNRSSEVLMKSFPPRRLDEGDPILGGKHE